MLKLKVKDVREFSSLGDSFVNLIYSLALSMVSGKPIGKRVHNHILREAIIEAGMRDLAGTRVDMHGLADYAEGYIFQGWIEGKISIEDCVGILANKLDAENIRKSSVEGFADLLKNIREKN